MAKTYKNPAATVDLLVFHQQGLVLIKRRDEPFKGLWALPGGYLNCGEETLEEAAVRELEEETSLSALTKHLRLVGNYSHPRRDPRGHVISHAYEVTKYSGQLCAGDDATEIRIFRKIPKRLAFDHAAIIRDYFERLGVRS